MANHSFITPKKNFRDVSILTNEFLRDSSVLWNSDAAGGDLTRICSTAKFFILTYVDQNKIFIDV